jgi:hypothetical protein
MDTRMQKRLGLLLPGSDATREIAEDSHAVGAWLRELESWLSSKRSVIALRQRPPTPHPWPGVRQSWMLCPSPRRRREWYCPRY